METMRVKSLLIVGLALAVAFTGGCKRHRPQIEPQLGQQGGAPETGTQQGEGLPDVDQERLLWDEATGLQRVYFDYDSFVLRSDAVSTLNDNASKIKQVPNVLIQIEGHCDERGTQEYNLALGEKRALAVRDYLIKVGVPSSRLVTISYGEERPAVDGHDESAWKFNRRCQFNKAVAN